MPFTPDILGVHTFRSQSSCIESIFELQEVFQGPRAEPLIHLRVVQLPECLPQKRDSSPDLQVIGLADLCVPRLPRRTQMQAPEISVCSYRLAFVYY